MARNASSSDRSIPHLRDIFWNGAPTSTAPAPPRTEWRTIRQDDVIHDVNELAYQFQNDARVSGRGGKGNGKDHHGSHHNSYHHSSHHHKQQQQQNDLGNDSAISVGSTSEDEHQAAPTSKKKSKKSRARDNARTLTERDVKHLERHLSMKKTIRKKIMRDLQQAFVEDPNEFQHINSHEQLIQSLSFGTPSRHAQRHTSRESNFLDMLRATDPSCAAAAAAVTPTTCSPAALQRHAVHGVYDDQDSGHGSPRGSPTRELSADRRTIMPSPPPTQQQHQHQGVDDYDDGGPADDSAGKKTSFWRRFTMKGKSKR